jgi:hypothetical protein
MKATHCFTFFPIIAVTVYKNGLRAEFIGKMKTADHA